MDSRAAFVVQGAIISEYPPCRLINLRPKLNRSSMAAKRGKRGYGKVGRPRKPVAEAKRNRITVTLTDAELMKLHRLAEKKGSPLGTVAYEIVARALARQR